MPTLLVSLAENPRPDAGNTAPYVVMLGLLALLIFVGIVWVARGRTARKDRSQRRRR